MSIKAKLFACTALAFTSLVSTAGPNEVSVDKAFSAWNSAFNKGDAKGVAALYTSDAVLLPPSHEVKSGTQIEQFFSGLLGNRVTGHTLEPIKIIDAGDTLIVASKWSAKGRDDKGNPTALGGIATHVLQKESGGSMKVKLHTFN